MVKTRDNDDVPKHLRGYRNDPKWRDMSDYLVHFTDTIDNLRSIIFTGEVKAINSYGWGRRITEVLEKHRSACLSEIPLDMLDRLVSRHGQFGIAFRKQLVLDSGGSRVWYLNEGYATSTFLQNVVNQLYVTQDFANDFWKLTPFIDIVIPNKYEWDWEREWRVPGGLNFNLEDVAFLVIPSTLGLQFVEDLGIEAPFIDPRDLDAYWESVPHQLGDFVDQAVAKFFANFSDPVEHHAWYEGKHVWLLMHSWKTEDAVDDLLGELEPTVRKRIIDHLNGISTNWVKLADLDLIGLY